MGIYLDPQKSFEWRCQAANQGRVDSQVIVANCYANGHGVEASEEKAAEWVEKAAQNGHNGAVYDIAQRYEKGHGVEENDATAVKWMEQAAEAGNAFACYKMGRRYLAGRGVDYDEAAALAWFDRAGEKGHVEAQASAGIQRLFPSVKGEHVRAKEALPEEAAEEELTPEEVEAKAEEALMARGQRLAIGIEQLQLAAGTGHPFAAFHLGLCYTRGVGLPVDAALAFESFVQAAASDSESMYSVAVCYAKGRGTEQDHTRATMWYEKAAKAGHAGGQYHLARRCPTPRSDSPSIFPHASDVPTRLILTGGFPPSLFLEFLEAREGSRLSS